MAREKENLERTVSEKNKRKLEEKDPSVQATFDSSAYKKVQDEADYMHDALLDFKMIIDKLEELQSTSEDTIAQWRKQLEELQISHEKELNQERAVSEKNKRKSDKKDPSVQVTFDSSAYKKLRDEADCLHDMLVDSKIKIFGLKKLQSESKDTIDLVWKLVEELQKSHEKEWNQEREKSRKDKMMLEEVTREKEKLEKTVTFDSTAYKKVQDEADYMHDTLVDFKMIIDKLEELQSTSTDTIAQWRQQLEELQMSHEKERNQEKEKSRKDKIMLQEVTREQEKLEKAVTFDSSAYKKLQDEADCLHDMLVDSKTKIFGLKELQSESKDTVDLMRKLLEELQKSHEKEWNQEREKLTMAHPNGQSESGSSSEGSALARFAITRCGGPTKLKAIPREVLQEILKLWKDKNMIRIVGDVGIVAEFVADVLKVIPLESTRNCYVGYEKSIELLERTSRKLDLLCENPTFDSTLASTTFKSYGAMLYSLLQTASHRIQSKDDMAKTIEAAEHRTILHEFPQLAKIYHCLKMCSHDDDFSYCPLDFYVANSSKCNVTHPDLLKIFMETMKPIASDPEGKCLCSIGNQPSSSGTSTSTQTDGKLPVDPAIQKLLDRLEDHINVRKSESDRQQNEIERLEKVKKMEEKKMEEKVKEHKKAVDDMLKEIANLEKNLEEQKRNFDNTIEEIKKDAEDLLKSQEAEAAKLLEEQEQTWRLEVEKQTSLAEEYKEKLEKALKDVPSTSTAGENSLKRSRSDLNDHIRSCRKKIEKGRHELLEFMKESDNESYKKKARIEFDNFEMRTEISIKQAQRNIDTLTLNQNAGSHELFNIQPDFGRPFTEETYAKMNPCNWCWVEFVPSDEVYVCGSYKCHRYHVTEWEQMNPTCHVCRGPLHHK